MMMTMMMMMIKRKLKMINEKNNKFIYCKSKNILIIKLFDWNI